jgi:hypothetical protein
LTVEVVAEAYDSTRAAAATAAEARSAAIIAEEAIAAVHYAAIASTMLKEPSRTFVYANANDDALVIFLDPIYFLRDPQWVMSCTACRLLHALEEF